MSSVLTDQSVITTQGEAWDEVEGYALTNNKILLISGEFKYVLYDCLTKNAESQGSFPETQNPENISLNQIYAYWFTSIGGTNVLYYSLTDKVIKSFDLAKPDNGAHNWSSGNIEVNQEHIHNFIWLHNMENEKDTCLFLHMLDNDKVALEKVKKGEGATRLGEQEVRNINWMMKDGDKLYFACNTEGKNFPIFIAHSEGITRFHFTTDFDATFVEFGFLTENKMFLLFNQGDKATVGCYLINIGALDLCSKEILNVTHNDENVELVLLHEQDDESIMIDAYCLVNRMMQTITVATSENSLVTWRFELDNEGKTKSSEERVHTSQIQNMAAICTNFSLDKGSL